MQTNQLAFCWSGKRVFATTGDGRVRVLSYPELVPALHTRRTAANGNGSDQQTLVEYTLNGHTSSCTAVELQPTGRYLATGGSDSLIALWDTADWICHRTLTGMSGPVRSISESTNRRHLRVSV